MSTAPKQVGLVEPVADLPTGGAVPLAVASRAEQLRSVVITQTTAGQTATLPDPVDTSVIFGLDVHNVGSATLTMYGVALTANSMMRVGWNGSSYSADVAPTATGATKATVTPTAQNVVPSVAAPQAGTDALFFVNGDLVSDGITMDGAGAISVVPATVGYNLETTDSVTVWYYT